ncbi:cobyric acid synthase [Desulfonatronovibrio hydrogenovorans]|uniref:cobyric acid synthase n=1 Tax=Desulfonatronovibrio hydrogenovorans TaxID=53245 RepID=UPI00054EC4A2|nr:cobyric acid synthase [Desulfonatronovibrio hydrogenovorans]
MAEQTNHPFRDPHGGNIYAAARAAGCSPDRIIDFSASINPLGPPTGTGKVLAQNFWKISHYPGPGSPGLVRAASRRFNLPRNMILAGNGATEIIDAAPRAFGAGRVVIPVPAYSGYAESARRNSLEIVQVFPSARKNDLFPQLEDLAAHLSAASLVYLGRPSNPTGHVMEKKELEKFISSHPQAFFIIDESFIDFTSSPTMAGSGLDNMVVVYSLTKFYALPGLRLGLAMGSPENIRKLARFISPWSVNVLAQEAGRVCLEDDDFASRSRVELARIKDEFIQNLEQIPWLRLYPGKANFILCQAVSSPLQIPELAARLLEKGILIRQAENFPGLDSTFFRLAVKTPEQNLRLCSILEGLAGKPRSKALKPRKTPALMVQGTSSGAGKSLLTAALGRLLVRQGVKVAPFKSQNMSLNSYVTIQGLEMGRAQVVQARACCLEPDVRMNPVLLKPNSDTGSQVIVLGKPVGNMNVDGYIRYKAGLFDQIKDVYDELAAEYDVMILEGAGSPAEINLKRHDLVNMNMALYARARVILVGDIDRGGVFASFVGTMELLEPWERELVTGLVINRFRGQKDLLQSAISYTETAVNCPVLGTIPYIQDLGLPEEDSVAFKNNRSGKSSARPDWVSIGIIDLPHISNFTDFDPLYLEPDTEITVIRRPEDFRDDLDAVILPGTKNVASDIRALVSSGLAGMISDSALHKNREVVGICGGLQILGLNINDPQGLESDHKTTQGLGLLGVETRVMPQKVLRQVCTHWTQGPVFPVQGYEIHHGRTRICSPVLEPIRRTHGDLLGVSHPHLNIWATYLHGIFDNDEFRRFWLDRIRKRKGLKPLERIQVHYQIDVCLDRLASIVEENMDLHQIYRILGI